MRQELINKLINHQSLIDEECFELVSEISCLMNILNEEKQSEGRELIIRVLDNWDNMPDSYKNVFTDLISAAGFYPYIQKLGLHIEDFSDEIRMSYHRSNYLDGKYFHLEQKKIDELIKRHVNVIVSAPTSFGKSMLIEEIVASREYDNIVIIQPTLALLDETRRKLKAYSDRYKIIVKTTQAYVEDKGNIFLLTAERVLEYPKMPPIQLLILDEFYKLSDKRGDNRSSILNIAFVRLMKNPDCRFYMLGPNIDAIPEGFVEKYNAIFYKTEFSMVLTESEDRYDDVKIQRGGKVYEEDVFEILDSINEQTLIYCASPSAARNLAFSYCAHLCAKGETAIADLPLVEWISDNLSYRWSLSSCLQYEIAVHDGAMPKHITSSVIQYFNQKRIRYLFCTNTIIEGVNTSAKNVLFYDNKIGSRKVDYFDYSNIKGRAGRMMEHYIGRIINLHKPPKSESTYAVGCMFGRYSLDTDGLAYAGGEWDDSKYSTFIPDKDNCIPITDEPYFEDDIVGLFCAWLKKVYGEDTLEENLDFIANALGNKGSTSREVIRNYFLNDFIKDHIKTYQKRPIYWLFDSGKQNGFKALVYMHRWDADTVGNLRVEYLHKTQRIYEREIQRMQETMDNSHDSREINKASKRKEKLQKQLKETKDYDTKLAHIALSRIDIDLDDGVKVNYEKVQTGRDGKKMQILAKI